MQGRTSLLLALSDHLPYMHQSRTVPTPAPHFLFNYSLLFFSSREPRPCGLQEQAHRLFAYVCHRGNRLKVFYPLYLFLQLSDRPICGEYVSPLPFCPDIIFSSSKFITPFSYRPYLFRDWGGRGFSTSLNSTAAGVPFVSLEERVAEINLRSIVHACRRNGTYNNSTYRYSSTDADTVSPPLILAWAFEEVVGSCATDQIAIARIAPIRKNDLAGRRRRRIERCLDDGVG